MNRDLRHFRPPDLKILEEMERMNRALKPALDISRSIEFLGLSQIVQANQCWQNLINQVVISSNVLDDFKHTHQSWLAGIRPMQNSIAQLASAAKLSLDAMVFRMTVSERIYAGIDFNSMQQALALPEPAFIEFQNVISDVMSTYGKLTESFRSLPDLTYLPAYALPGATREIFITGYTLDAIRISDKSEDEKDSSVVQLTAEVKQETSNCIGLLQTVYPDLAILYFGAHEALHGKNVDRKRHILSSLRELWNHLLRRLAPDEHVLSWASTTDEKNLLDKGKPTRRSRVLYVCRNLNHGPLADFVVQDTHALVKLLDVFNRIHELDPKLSDEQLRALLFRSDSWVMYILHIGNGL